MDPDMSYAQGDLIQRLLDDRRISRSCAEHIIELLIEQPPINDNGMDTLKKIQNLR